MGEAKRKKLALARSSRVCPVRRERCYAAACQAPSFCQRTQQPKGEPWMMKGSLGHPPRPDACRECPLSRTSAAGYLGGYSVENYLQILHGDAAIACHMSPGFHERDHARQRHCTGVCAYRANVSKLPRDSGSQEAIRLIGPDRERFFATPAEFAAHHRSPK